MLSLQSRTNTETHKYSFLPVSFSLPPTHSTHFYFSLSFSDSNPSCFLVTHSTHRHTHTHIHTHTHKHTYHTSSFIFSLISSPPTPPFLLLPHPLSFLPHTRTYRHTAHIHTYTHTQWQSAFLYSQLGLDISLPLWPLLAIWSAMSPLCWSFASPWASQDFVQHLQAQFIRVKALLCMCVQWPSWVKSLSLTLPTSKKPHSASMTPALIISQMADGTVID